MNVISALEQHGHKPCLECEENKCKLEMNGVRNYGILRDETIRRIGRMADCLIFQDKGDGLNLMICELKSMNFNEKRIREQISAGITHSIPILKSIQSDKIPKIVLIVLIKSRIKRSYGSRLRRRKINAYNQQHPIFIRPCGSKFSDIMKLVA